MSRDLLNKLASELEASGYAKGYRQAVRDMRREMNASLDNMLRDAAQPEPNTKTPKIANDPQPDIVVFAQNQAGKSGHVLVLQTIEAKPGLRGSEVVSELQKAGTPVHERTVRTALYRLRKGGSIEAKDGRWYTTHDYREVFE